jgi:hypothetical protein
LYWDVVGCGEGGNGGGRDGGLKEEKERSQVGKQKRELMQTHPLFVNWAWKRRNICPVIDAAKGSATVMTKANTTTK